LQICVFRKLRLTGLLIHPSQIHQKGYVAHCLLRCSCEIVDCSGSFTCLEFKGGKIRPVNRPIWISQQAVAVHLNCRSKKTYIVIAFSSSCQGEAALESVKCVSRGILLGLADAACSYRPIIFSRCGDTFAHQVGASMIPPGEQEIQAGSHEEQEPEGCKTEFRAPLSGFCSIQNHEKADEEKGDERNIECEIDEVVDH
jgi:hypothetical protein